MVAVFFSQLTLICGLFPFDSVKDIADGLMMEFSTISKNNDNTWILQAGYAMQARVRNNINIQGKTGTKSL